MHDRRNRWGGSDKTGHHLAGYADLPSFGGIGQGLAFLGSLALVDALMPQDRRGSILATYYALVYISFGATAIGVGWLATHLDLNHAVQVFAVVIGSLCIITMALLLRESRQPKPRAEVTPVLQNN